MSTEPEQLEVNNDPAVGDNATSESVNTETPESSETPTEPSQAKSIFPDDWQDVMSDGDEKIKAALSRYGSPKDVAKALREGQVKLSERNKITKPDENATEEELKTWRDAMGIPEKPEGYKISEIVGSEISETDKPFYDQFAKAMHDAHASPDVVKAALGVYQDMQAKNEAYLEEVNKQDAQECEEVLREDYGRNFTDNKARALTYMEKTFGKEAAEVITKAVGNDGRQIINNPDIMRQFVNMALEDNPRVTLPQGAKSVESLASRKAEIEAELRKHNGGNYYSNPAMQKEYREILDFEQKSK